VPIQPQVFTLLLLLLEHRERVVTKDELVEHVWNGRAISDSALNARINALRRRKYCRLGDNQPSVSPSCGALPFARALFSCG
jgi:DNA-binding winged helix-turn-helix (wHTH) protein